MKAFESVKPSLFRRVFWGSTPLWRAIVFIAPLVAAALVHVWSNVTTLRLGYGLSKASDQHRELIEENRGLRIELEALRAPKRLERLATERFGLMPPGSEQIVRVERRKR